MTAVAEAPTFAVLTSPGTNRDQATKAALELAGAKAEIVQIGALEAWPQTLYGYQGLVIPGGFSHGDDIQSAVVLALRMQRMKYELEEFAKTKKRPIIGVCNGFQALVQTGLLPFGEMVSRDALVATLARNENRRFESRWVRLASQESVSAFVRSGNPASFPVDHGEGNFSASREVIQRIEQSGQVVYQYVDAAGSPTQNYPENPNGSTHAIAGLTDPTGVIFGMMPHPEDFIRPEHHPNWRRQADREPDGLRFFREVVLYAAGL